MDNLFIEPELMEKVARRSLGEDASKWVKEIILEFTEEFPEFRDVHMTVTWKQRDKNAGAAVGTLHVGDEIAVPLIVQENRLYPLDLVMFGGRVFPLTREVVAEYFSNPDSFAALAELPQQSNEKLFVSPLRLPTDIGSSNTLTYPANALDKVSSFVHAKDYNRVMDEVSEPQNYAQFSNNGTLDVIEKLSSIEPKNEVNFAKALLNNIDMDRQVVITDDYGNSFLKQANSKIDHEFLIPIDNPDNFSNKYAESSEKDEAVNACVNSYTIDDNVMSITKEGEYHMFGDEVEVPVNNSNFDIEGSEPNLGDTGVFIVGNSSTKPFEVVEVQKVAGAGNYEVKGWDGLNKTAYYPVRGIEDDNLIPHDVETNAFYVPGNAKFVKLAGKLDITFDVVDSNTSPQIIQRDSAGLYSFTGSEFTKYATNHFIRDLSVEEAQWTATHCGATEAHLRPSESLQFESNITAPIAIENLQTRLQEEYDNVTEASFEVPSTLVKEAAGIADANSVDAILSLGLVNRDNVMEFTTLIPEYEAASAGMAKLLLTARLGLKIVNEDALKRGMESLVKAVYQLKHLKSLLGK